MLNRTKMVYITAIFVMAEIAYITVADSDSETHRTIATLIIPALPALVLGHGFLRNKSEKTDAK